MERTLGDYFISDTDGVVAPNDEPVTTPDIRPVTEFVGSARPAAGRTPARETSPAMAAPTVEPQAPVAPQPVTPALPREERGEQLSRALDDLLAEDARIRAAALVSLDGLTMASALPASMQADRVSAMSAAILGLGERAAAELGRGQLTEVIIDGADGYVLLLAAGTHAVLTVIADREAKLGLVQYEMRRAAEDVARVLG